MSDVNNGNSPYTPRNVQSREQASSVAGDAARSSARDPWGRPIKQQAEPPQRQRAEGDNKDNADNDDGVDDGTIDNIWDDIKKKKTEDDDEPPANNQKTEPEDPQKQITDYLVGIGLDPIVLSDADKEELKSGEFGNVINKLNDKIRNAHLKAMSGSKKMLDASIDDAVKRALDGADQRMSGRMNLQALHTALPFTKEKAISPVAQTVMQKFINRGLSTEDAIDGVRRWFAKTSDLYTGSMVTKNRNVGYGARPNSADNGEGGWLDILRG